VEHIQPNLTGHSWPERETDPDELPAVEPMVTVSRASNPADTRSALLDAAEMLFARHGVEGPSLREINRVAGQKNTTALQYHFRDRKSLLSAVLARHVSDVAIRRQTLLDLYGQSLTREPRPLVNALVLPLLAKLTDLAGGPNFLSIAAELMNRGVRTTPGEPAALLVYDELKTLQSWSRLIEQFLPAETLDEPFHRRHLAVRFVYSELGRCARTGEYVHSPLYASHLVDTVSAMLLNPVSVETRGLLDRGASEL
jgi:AcrR family transcriptional regulator